MVLFIIEEWMDDAECNYASDLDIFFPDGPHQADRIRKAEATCWRCPVSDECLEFALKYNIQHGIFAGLLPDQRNAIKKARKRDELPKCG